MTAPRRVLLLVFLTLVLASPLGAQLPRAEARERCLGTNPNAPVLIEVFSDHQCPACRRLYLETMRRVIADYANTGKVCVVYHEFPLRVHAHARTAARYAQAAARLGKTKWVEVADRLYYYQSKWAADGQVESVVAQVLTEKEMAQVRKWVADPKLEAAIDRDVALGRQRGVRSTPTLFITASGHTERVNGVVQYAILQRYLDRLLARR
ncbi:MAG: DsbA family protein [Terriglobia bacterium]